ncbi:hypothetical protein [Nocardia brasiliensis]|uniref:hypothetical protein n=1 Tax=Nocardia brasiliensis TaxID=37326 RepID=UPI0024581329|nr:hypothetical protein [Nocardia brasiliensis]
MAEKHARYHGEVSLSAATVASASGFAVGQLDALPASSVAWLIRVVVALGGVVAVVTGSSRNTLSH